jgi:hypothetical protein
MYTCLINLKVKYIKAQTQIIVPTLIIFFFLTNSLVSSFFAKENNPLVPNTIHFQFKTMEGLKCDYQVRSNFIYWIMKTFVFTRKKIILWLFQIYDMHFHTLTWMGEYLSKCLPKNMCVPLVLRQPEIMNCCC